MDRLCESGLRAARPQGELFLDCKESASRHMAHLAPSLGEMDREERGVELQQSTEILVMRPAAPARPVRDLPGATVYSPWKRPDGAVRIQGSFRL